MVSRAQDPALASMLNNYLFLNRTMAYDADFDKKTGSTYARAGQRGNEKIH